MLLLLLLLVIVEIVEIVPAAIALLLFGDCDKSDIYGHEYK